MSPKEDIEPPPKISDDQLSLLIRVCERAQSTFSFADWKDIASTEGDTAEANRQRFNYIMHKLYNIDSYNKGQGAAEYKPAEPIKKRGAKRALSPPLEEDEEQMGGYTPQKPAPRLILRHGPKKAKAETEKE